MNIIIFKCIYSFYLLFIYSYFFILLFQKAFIFIIFLLESFINLLFFLAIPFFNLLYFDIYLSLIIVYSDMHFRKKLSLIIIVDSLILIQTTISNLEKKYFLIDIHIRFCRKEFILRQSCQFLISLDIVIPRWSFDFD